LRLSAPRQTVAVGIAEGIKLPPDMSDKTLALLHSMPPHGPSTSPGLGRLSDPLRAWRDGR
jgi:hypothetical protein